PHTAVAARRPRPLGELSGRNGSGTSVETDDVEDRSERNSKRDERGRSDANAMAVQGDAGNWRRGRDSNPRCFRTPLFESGTINHSDTSARERIAKAVVAADQPKVPARGVHLTRRRRSGGLAPAPCAPAVAAGPAHSSSDPACWLP